MGIDIVLFWLITSREVDEMIYVFSLVSLLLICYWFDLFIAKLGK